MPTNANARRVPLIGSLALTLFLTVALAACGGEGDSGADADPAVPTVVATTGIVADIVTQVGGEDVEVVQLIPDGSSPHSYSPSAREQQELVDADLVVYVSPTLEEALPLGAADTSFALADHVGRPRTIGADEVEGAGHGHEEDGHEGDEHEDDEHEEGHEDAHGAGAADPHVWLDPTRVRAALPELAEALAELDPNGARAYRDRADAYAAELDELDVELAEMLDRVPPENRKLVTSHDLIGYFADRYGLEFIGAPFALTPEAEASAGAIADLIAAIEAEQVPAVFAQQGDDPKVLRQVAESAGVVIVDDLLLESLSDEVGSYAEMMRFSTAKIAEALSD